MKGSKEKRRTNEVGQLMSVAISMLLFLVLLQLFDPLSKSKGPGAVELGLKEFSRGHTTEFNDTDIHRASTGREYILHLLEEAGISDLSPQQISMLPHWRHIEDLYGPNVVIVGKDRCETYRKSVRLTDRYVGVAGLFNTGTNLLQLHLFRNIKGVQPLWQVPWGKHRMAAVKDSHTADGMKKVVKENVLPVVIVRDPLAWLQSMCAHPYATHWRHDKHHCPNMVPNEDDKNLYKHLKSSFQVTVKYDKAKETHWVFDSLVHFWSEYHRQYMEADYPVLFIRYEDLVFQPRIVLGEIADCLGAELKEPLQYQVKTSKSHGSGTDYIKAIRKTADSSLRLHNMTQADREFSQQYLDARIMETFHYRGPMESISSSL